ncbi:nucleotide excision repair endonuclease [Bacillus cytotoxicus]|uniref:Excinuclease ABC, C subunit, N-terminal region n=2 Tax=Bacillus cytotoxicus TaxID=580165 RepID=A0AAX2CGU0_9BACI|nr:MULTISPECIES: nucleotide excision repair endonuclease [Bacillus cereus group]ABS22140.1 Excinuclease ABC C subunit domain protein [Bacillus cytotoxicus NVH 391-98]AWC28746.1 nucleotide excision repair endonuclease [Bacillus cytotoxicus]AWC32758.1 nucleotide excision repair endonuclease [Bacillus cytotoxicus]AWC36785.1 nucleotide excision repair endonuclease [Bacillus cytotoxicus]AWC39871.1 nucleotide excision repair endonuclease [Bacillus cytotoxicus]
MIKIDIPAVDISITERKQIIKGDEPRITPIHGFIDFHLFPRDKGGIFMFYNIHDELLFVGKARKIRQRIKKHFEDNVSPMKAHRDEVYRIDVCLVEDPMEREIYETYIINTLQAKYNIDKVFYK